MRTAICLSGELRSIENTLPSFKEYLFGFFETFDLFYFAWKDDPDIAKLKHLVQTNQLKDLELEDRHLFNEAFYFPNRKSEPYFQPLIRQMYCLKRVNDLKKTYEEQNGFKYDTVIRLRPDLLIRYRELHPLTFDTDAVTFLDHDDWHGYADRLYFGNSEHMDILSERIHLLPKYNAIGGRNQYEAFLQFTVNYHDIPHRTTNVYDTCLLRTNGDRVGEKISIEKGEIIRLPDGRIWHDKEKAFI